MDNDRFDQFVKRLATRTNRRTVARGLFGTVGGLIGVSRLSDALGASCRATGRLCREDANCCTGLCDPASHKCVCPAGTESCRGNCKIPADYQADVSHCGACGNRCPGVANGTATCANGFCGFACDAGFHPCGDACYSDQDVTHCGASCTVCPSPANGAATCDGGVCDFVCDSGFHRCGDGCFRDDDATHCGAACIACSPPDNATATCTGGVCGFACDAGFTWTGDTCCPEGLACGEVCLRTPCNELGCQACDAARGACVFTCTVDQVCIDGICYDRGLT
jgi:hypothetical protein